MPLIHSARFIYTINYYICPKYILNVVRLGVSWYRAYLTIVHAPCTNTHLKAQSRYRNSAVFHTVRAGAYWHEVNGMYPCAFVVRSKWFMILCHTIKFLFLFSLLDPKQYLYLKFQALHTLGDSLSFLYAVSTKDNKGLRNFQVTSRH